MPIDHDDLTLTIPPNRYAAMQAILRRNLTTRGAVDLLPMMGLVDLPTPCGIHAAGQHCTRLAGHEGKHRWAHMPHTMINCRSCGAYRRHDGRGMCGMCAARDRRSQARAFVCANCGKSGTHRARGLCVACYHDHQRGVAKAKPAKLPVGWQDTAACGGDLGWFERGADEAMAVCSTCPVIGWCRIAAEAEPYSEGVWGGQLWHDGRRVSA